MDDDNEVRDRATFYLNVLEQKQKALNASYILNGEPFLVCLWPPTRGSLLFITLGRDNLRQEFPKLSWQLHGMPLIPGDLGPVVYPMWVETAQWIETLIINLKTVCVVLYCLSVPAGCIFIPHTNPVKGVLEEEVEAQRIRWLSQGHTALIPGSQFSMGDSCACYFFQAEWPLSHWPLGLTVSIPGLERALQQYTLEPSEKPFDLKSVPLATAPMAEQRTGE